jgi:hypothetical protein
MLSLQQNKPSDLRAIRDCAFPIQLIYTNFTDRTTNSILNLTVTTTTWTSTTANRVGVVHLLNENSQQILMDRRKFYNTTLLTYNYQVLADFRRDRHYIWENIDEKEHNFAIFPRLFTTWNRQMPGHKAKRMKFDQGGGIDFYQHYVGYFGRFTIIDFHFSYREICTKLLFLCFF